MDRRRFLAKTGLLAAGSAFGGAFVSCGVELNLPCLGPAAAPTPVPGMTYIRASQIGCALDCNLENGRNKHHGGPATDDAPRINAAMAGASASNPMTLIIDGGALISGLYLPAGGHWSIAGLGCGTGFFLKSGSNSDAIHNGPANAAIPFDPGPPAPARGANVSLSNFAINGNAGNGSNGDSTTGEPQGGSNGFYCCVNLMNLNNITIENVVVVNSPAYHFRLSNVGNVTVSGCVMRSTSYNTDGLHFDGPANDISISNCNFTTGDDSIALNCPEGHGGDIKRVVVANCVFNSWSLMRLYTVGPAGKFKIDTVSVSGCSGTLTEGAFFVGYVAGSNPNSITGLTISDCSVTASCVLAMAENFGTIALSNVTWTPSSATTRFYPQQTDERCGFLRTSPVFGTDSYIGSSLSFNNCVIQRTSNTQAAAVIIENESTIDQVQFNGLALQDADAYSPLPELLSMDSGSVGELALNAITSQGIQSPVSPGGFANIGTVSGAGVLATGWEFPDAVMANEVPYISANSGLPSIKINGVVEPYPQS
jgi:hypothetical protein